MRMLGIDYGTKKIGLALTDENGRFASPYLVIPTNQETLKTVVDICQKEEIAKVVVGKSLNYEGTPNAVQAEAENFAKALVEATGLPIEFELEVLTTKQAERDIGRDELTDARAAALILKSYIDRQTK